MSWSISVKTVGGDIPTSVSNTSNNTSNDDNHNESGSINPTTITEKPKPTNFVVQVEPDDLMSSLHKKIEDMTGLKTSQQRLIYRGRIISGGPKKPDENLQDESTVDDNGSRLRDVAGLGDGQTIHLVPRPIESNPASTSSEAINQNNTSSSSSSNNDSGNASIELLAALLGIGSGGLSGDNDDNEDANSTENDLGNLFSLPRTRAARSNARRRRANSHRRTANDPRYPEPGSLEPVRQGMMTLHTMTNSLHSRSKMNAATGDTDTYVDEKKQRSFDAVRSWYRGQWLDCRDTVNQWLEATVVDIVKPKDILNSLNTDKKPYYGDSKVPASDPAVGANDFEGRRRLLLKMAENELDDELAKANGGDEDLKGFRERDNNQNVQLLLIHYNGWPHRWDEWIRSDSERIRPFRTRSRHNPNRSSYANPTPQSVFHASPPTYFRDENETIERAAVLPELYRMLMSVNDLVSEAIPDEIHEKLIADNTDISEKEQPWMNHREKNVRAEHDEDDECAEKVDDDKCDDSESHQVHKFDKKKLETLAPLLDRLGRTLTDAAPHIAAFADTLSETQSSGLVDMAENVESTSLTNPNNESELQNLSTNLQTSEMSADDTSTTPLLPSSGTENTGSEDDPANDQLDENDPDYVDFVNGFINVSTNDRIMSGRNSSRRLDRVEEGPSNFGSSLLSAYLASSGSSNSNTDNNDNNDNNGDDGNGNSDDNGNGNSRGPRIVRFGGGNNDGGGLGPGIDIHIHAIVTGPGGGVAGGTGGGLGGLAGLAAMGLPLNLGSTTPSRPTATSITPSAVATPTTPQEDDDGLFSDLYSESPAPVDLSTTLSSHNDSNANQNPTIETMDIESDNVSMNDSTELDMPPLVEPIAVLPDNVEPSNDTLYLLGERQTMRNSDELEHSSVHESSLNESTSTRSSSEPRTAFGRFFRRALGRRHHGA